jgi:hypothetical protein
MNPKPYTGNPKPYTLNPKLSTLNPQPYTFNPKPETLNQVLLAFFSVIFSATVHLAPLCPYDINFRRAYEVFPYELFNKPRRGLLRGLSTYLAE